MGTDVVNFILHPWQLLLFILAGWVNREQQQVIEYLKTENRVLREKLGKKRLLLNDNQRRRLAIQGKRLGRKMLDEVGVIFTPDTILRWHRELIARKWDYSKDRKAVGRPRIRQEIVELILKIAQDNPSWGCDRIQGALANAGYHITDRTVGNVLKRHGIEPAPDRSPTLAWKTFLKAHWETIFAADFTTVEVWTKTGLTTFYVLVVMELKSRRVKVSDVTTNPHRDLITQVGRNLTGCDEFLEDATHLIIDRDTNFRPLRTFLRTQTNVEPVLLPPKSPNLNAYLERWMRSLKTECLNRMIFFGQHSLELA